MNNRIYYPSGFLNIGGILSYNCTFNFIVGGRGTGKTYGALKTVVDNDLTFMLMRRTQKQTDMINKPEFSPFKKLATDEHLDISTKSVSKDNARFEMNGRTIGYTCALSTISSMRGFDASDVKILVYDEFVPEKHERPFKEEGLAFLNCYETLNRNRELFGEKPLTVLCLANAFNIANPVFLELGLVGIAEKMILEGRELYINRDKSILLCLPDSAKIKDEKSNTALYKLTEGSSFNKMALENDFVFNPRDFIKSAPLKEYRPMVTIGEITIYKHKSQRRYYVSEHRTGNPPTFTTDDVGLKKYRKNYGLRLYKAYMQNLCQFENILTKSLFECYNII